MADELPLPRLAWNPATESFSQNTARKRIRLSSPPASSDPAIFSSDDDPSAENYTAQERRGKRKYRGPWYMQRPAEPEAESQESITAEARKTKRPFERQFDSGVFMGSDGTDMDDGIEVSNAAIPLSLPQIQPQTVQTVRQPDPENAARRHIELCLEDGTESIDLSYVLQTLTNYDPDKYRSKSLTAISNATIRPLATFTRIPAIANNFHKLEPKLKLFLSSNYLTTLPGELFNLERLVFLTLRNNELRELPPSIGKLKNLHELNLSQNGLRYLPYEILNLLTYDCHLSSLHLHPNKFHEPQYSYTKDTEVEEVQYQIGLGNRTRRLPIQNTTASAYITKPLRVQWNERWKVNFQARTDIRYLDITGKLVKGPIFPACEEDSQSSTHSIPVVDIDDLPQPPISRGGAISRAPSLIEVALNACSRNPKLPYFADMLDEEMTPPYMYKILSDAAMKKESGGSQCTICKRNFVLPRTEWIEWWEIAKNVDPESGLPSAASPLRQMENDRDVLESMVPLMRRGCSWLCVPKQLVKWQLVEDILHGDVHF
ncbi:leucine Rich Repeat family protein [Diplocarpon rosae]|nr:leucine Rich Repeat family protein [Diplocarpon rosae]